MFLSLTFKNKGKELKYTIDNDGDIKGAIEGLLDTLKHIAETGEDYEGNKVELEEKYKKQISWITTK